MLGQARGSLSDGLTAPPSGGEMTAALLSHIDKAVVCVTLLLLGHTPLPSLSPLFCLTAPRSLLTPTTVHNEWTFSCEINSRSSMFMWTMVTESVCKSSFSISSLLSSESQIISLWRHISLKSNLPQLLDILALFLRYLWRESVGQVTRWQKQELWANN